ncbi:MAG: NEW3 domain-containing protein [Rectinema subterraneum]|uniref:COG1470 family protein n=1 Tax=Rectinema subterraneum TaxID=2653714 RepID=UPI003C79C864
MWRAIVLLLMITAEAFGQTNQINYRGLSISTDYPSITTTPGKLIVLPLKVRNYDLPPQRVNIEVARKPGAWKTSLVGGGNLVQAVFVSPGDSANVELWIEPPSNAAPGNYDFILEATGNGESFRLPITVVLGKTLPQQLSLSADFPSLEGTANTQFNYVLTIRNISATDILVNLKVDAPAGFDVRFTEEYGNKELNSIPIQAGQSKNISAKITPPENTAAGTYNVAITAFAESASARQELALVIRGKPNLTLSGSEERLSLDATAGHEKTIDVTIKNTGGAEAHNIGLSSSAPSNWKVAFDPEKIESIAAGQDSKAKVRITPAANALAGDYMVNLSARSGDGVSASQDFRVTVRTSTLWGIIAVLIIAAAVLVAVLAIRRYGRR